MKEDIWVFFWGEGALIGHIMENKLSFSKQGKTVYLSS